MTSNNQSKLVLRRTRKRFNPKVFINRTIETFAIGSLLLTGFSGVGAMACWGLEIIETKGLPNKKIYHRYRGRGQGAGSRGRDSRSEVQKLDNLISGSP
ncbi:MULTISPECIES: hypothetical protein [Nostoc]|uniref:hypothetical protein n=1 Tax=Nostoc TaxID=1177 RepID=UPI001F5508C5|nr:MULTISPECIES: hypothetical protein [Nostoc]